MFNFLFRNKKKLIGISGNCVTGVIPEFLKTNSWFNEHYECKILTPIYMIKTKEEIDTFKKSVSMCDVFLPNLLVVKNTKIWVLIQKVLKRF